MSRMQDEMTCTQSKIHAGIDVGKEQLDVFIQSHPKGFSLPNTKAAIRKLITQLKKHQVALVALEATGRYHLAHSMFHDAGIAVAVINPYRSRQFSESLGRMAKTTKSMRGFWRNMPKGCIPSLQNRVARRRKPSVICKWQDARLLMISLI